MVYFYMCGNLGITVSYVEWNDLYLHVWNLVDNFENVELNGLCLVFICVESCG